MARVGWFCGRLSFACSAGVSELPFAERSVLGRSSPGACPAVGEPFLAPDAFRSCCRPARRSTSAAAVGNDSNKPKIAALNFKTTAFMNGTPVGVSRWYQSDQLQNL